MTDKNKRYTLGEEIFNASSHGAGVLLSVAALVLLIVFAAVSPAPLKAYRIVSGCIYGTTLILMYTCSTLYHAFTHDLVKRIFQVFDHCSIYLLIAGTYTPFALVTLNGIKGWTIFGVIWGVAFVGILLDAFQVKKSKWISTLIYLAMGYFIVLDFKALAAAIPLAGIVLLLIGGLCYTLGAVFYLLKKVRYMHSIWHLFVLAGSIFHFFTILLYVIR